MALFLINSRLGLLSAAPHSFKQEPHFFRSYVCILPSSLTRGRSCALDFSSHLRVSVSGTVPSSLALDSISRHLDSIRFTSPSLGSLTAQLSTWIFLRTSTPYCFDGNYRSPAGFHLMRPAFETKRSIGILTNFPSTTTFVLALGTDLPRADCLYPGNLRFSADGDLTRLFVTYACILSSVSSRTPHRNPFMGLRNAPLPPVTYATDPWLRCYA